MKISKYLITALLLAGVLSACSHDGPTRPIGGDVHIEINEATGQALEKAPPEPEAAPDAAPSPSPNLGRLNKLPFGSLDFVRPVANAPVVENDEADHVIADEADHVLATNCYQTFQTDYEQFQNTMQQKADAISTAIQEGRDPQDLVSDLAHSQIDALQREINSGFIVGLIPEIDGCIFEYGLWLNGLRQAGADTSAVETIQSQMLVLKDQMTNTWDQLKQQYP